MTIKLHRSELKPDAAVTITGSKSESNRLLVLQALYPKLKIKNLSNADDTKLMQKALRSTDELIDIGHAGTTMRFLTAYFASQSKRELLLTGSDRMQERPIQILVDALNELGADISYENKAGYPPLRIKGKKLSLDKVGLPASVSSQYISALLLMAPNLENGLELTLEGELTSIPYINMTLELLNQIGVDTFFEENLIKVFPFKGLPKQKSITVESDWSSASYFYSLIALSEPGTQMRLSFYEPNSLQGDSILAKIYNAFGVKTIFKDESIILRKTTLNKYASAEFELNDAPDLAQTIAITCLGLGMSCHMTGLHTLKIKETDRLKALKAEMEKLGAIVTITEKSLTLEAA
ncbi:MAG: 3-phosphoshikimate 1-carboxyvinyltransferase, partial [Bacteroidia bacterium]|nr:3-phosphoshikimate 1-carboxyvinyltransferase [Bacteroidia bacterium]